MPRIVKRRADVARRITTALANIEAQMPKDAGLRKRANAGTLKTNFNTVHIESGVERHLFDKPSSLYAAEYNAIVAVMPKRGTVVPLRKQLDRERRRLETSEARLQRSRTYAAQLLILMQKMDVEIARLKEEIANGPASSERQLIGTGRVTSMPPVKRRTKPKAGAGRGQSTPGVGR